MEDQLRGTKDELCRRSKELKESQLKLNDNYKLMAEMSNENLRLTGENARAEERAEEMRREQRTLREELTSAQRVLETLNKHRPYYGSRSRGSSWHRSSSPGGGGNCYSDNNSHHHRGGGASSALEMSPHGQGQQQSRGHHRNYHRKGNR